MYLSYYNLEIEPFSISADPKFLWLGEKHKEALAALKYGILANKGFLLLTGDVGTGKTTLINALLNNLGDQIQAATVHDPGLEKLDFLNFIAGAFKLNKNFRSKGEFLSYFSVFLKLSHDKNKKVLLIIDEAQRLNDDLLEEIRLLSNIEKQHTKLINIFFVGQNEFNQVLMKTENRALRQRITLVHTLEMLNRGETHEYIHYRLQVAGSTRNIFKPHAVEEVYAFSGGYPRLINIICDRALLTGFVKEKKVIDAQIIRECANELRIPIKSYEKENSGLPLPAAGQNAAAIAEKRPPRLTIRTVFLLVLLLLAAAAFYYQHRTGAADIHLLKPWNRLMDAWGFKKAQSDFQTRPADEPDNMAVTYRIPVTPRLNPPEPSRGNEMPVHPAIVAAAENAAQAPAAKDAKAVKLSDKDGAAAFKKKFNIFFEYNSFALSDEALAELDKIASVMRQHPDRNITIKGYTDNTGKFSYNLKLSELRADAVKSHLVQKGLNPLKMGSLGLGPDQTMDDRIDQEKNRMNRRVEIEFN